MSYPWSVEFYLDDDGAAPVAKWITEVLTPAERRAVTAALRELVAALGHDVCATEFGKNLGGGLIELRLRQSEDQILKRVGREPSGKHPEDEAQDILLRIFFHPHGQKVALVLHGYSKGRKPSKSHQQAQIEIAESRLRHWKERMRVAAKAQKHGPKKRG